MAVTFSAPEYHYGDILCRFKTVDEAPIEKWQGEEIPVNSFGFELSTGNLYYYDDDNSWKLVGGGA